MLHMTIREWESIHVDGPAEISVTRSRRNRVWVSIAAPDTTVVVRSGAKRRDARRRGRRDSDLTATPPEV